MRRLLHGNWPREGLGLGVKSLFLFSTKELAHPLKLDLLVEGKVIVEGKATIAYNPVFEAQALTYLRLTDLRLALVINFGERRVSDGIHRVGFERASGPRTRAPHSVPCASLIRAPRSAPRSARVSRTARPSRVRAAAVAGAARARAPRSTATTRTASGAGATARKTSTEACADEPAPFRARAPSAPGELVERGRDLPRRSGAAFVPTLARSPTPAPARPARAALARPG